MPSIRWRSKTYTSKRSFESPTVQCRGRHHQQRRSFIETGSITVREEEDRYFYGDILRHSSSFFSVFFFFLSRFSGSPRSAFGRLQATHNTISSWEDIHNAQTVPTIHAESEFPAK